MAKMSRQAFLRGTVAMAAAGVISKVSMGRPVYAAAATPRATLIKGADVLTMDAKLGSMTQTDVLIEGGKIAAIGKDLAVEGAEMIDAKGMILMPGMIDGHRHMWHNVDSGGRVKTEPRGYMGYHRWRTAAHIAMTPEDHHFGCYLGGVTAIDSGVTTLMDYAHGQHTMEKAEAAARGTKESGVSGWFTYQLGLDPNQKPGDTIPPAAVQLQGARATPENFAIAEKLMKDHFSDSSAAMQFGLAPATGNGQPLADIKEEWTKVRSYGLKMLGGHLHKLAKPAPEGYMGYRDSGIRDLYDAGLLGPDYHISHGNALTAEELQLFRDTGAMICATAMGEFPYMMQSNRGPAVHGRARAAGVAVGIGIDVSASLTLDFFEHARAAFWSLFLSPEGTKIATEYKSEDTLDFATALGAKALRLGDVTGSITVGKRADLILLSTRRIGFATRGSLADRVLNYATQGDIDSVWVVGKLRKQGGKMIGIDWDKMKAQQISIQERIAPIAATVKFS